MRFTRRQAVLGLAATTAPADAGFWEVGSSATFCNEAGSLFQQSRASSRLDSSKPNLPIWEVLSGTKIVPAQTHRLSGILVEQGAVIEVVPRSRRWLVLHVEGDIVLRGNISFRDFIYSDSTISVTAPDGTLLEHTPTMQIGGRGAKGSDAGHFRGGQGAPGGLGYGGGGGGPAGSARQPPGGAGAPGDGALGGLGFFSGRGGNGGNNAGHFNNGGLIYLCATGVIDFQGFQDTR